MRDRMKGVTVMRKRAGRKRKTNTPIDPMDIRAGVRRRPCGEIHQERPPGPHEEHLKKRAALGYERGEHFEEGLAIYWIPVLTRQQIDAGIRFGVDWSNWCKSIGAQSVQAQKYERYAEHRNTEETEFDVRSKERFLMAQDVLKNAGRKAKRAVETVITQNTMPPDEEEVVSGLNSLVAYYEKGIRKAA